MTEATKITDVVRTTAENMHTMLLQLAEHIDALEAENLELKARLDNVTK
jgi:uncharacterized coiled-coil DUF342 family protein